MSAPYTLAIPRNGSLRHIIHNAPEKHIAGMRHLSFAKALCGVRGATPWGGGSMRIVDGDPAETDCRDCKKKHAARAQTAEVFENAGNAFASIGASAGAARVAVDVLAENYPADEQELEP